MTVSRALGLTFAFILLLTAALVYNTRSSLETVAENATQVTARWMPRLLSSQQIQAYFLELRVGYLTHMTSLTDKAMTEAENLIDAQRRTFEAAMKSFKSDCEDDPQALELVEKINVTYASYVAQSEELISLSRSNNKEDAVKVLDRMTEIATPLLVDIKSLIAHNLESVDASVEQGQSIRRMAAVTSLAAGASVCIVIILSSIYVVFGVARPIRRLQGVITMLASGQKELQIPYRGRGDEIGEIAKSVEVFRQAAITNERLEMEAKSQRKAAEADQEFVRKEAQLQAQKKLEEASSKIGDGLRRLAKGQLDLELTEPFAVEFEGLRHDLNASVQQLSRTLIAVSKATANIDAGLREIDAGAENLSMRTERQASSLASTAASLDHITYQVEEANKRLMTARTLVTTATERAQASESVVRAAEGAMLSIETSSSKISMIIGVIDEISFQTNLLALNAGVEAARAGEAGNGFAVVASEVRELARRSAGAAREIRELIAGSERDVQTGVDLVRRTALALGDIREVVSSVHSHMDAITSNAHDQSRELKAINLSIYELDALTKNNVELVSTTNLETKSLAGESSNLQSMLSTFALPAEARRHAA